jgi:hypothetical protein
MRHRTEHRAGKAAAWNLPLAERPVVVEGESGDLIEDYLDHLCAPLVGAVPFDVRRELRSEVRAHLEAHAAACEELGDAPNDAVHDALARFGEPRSVGEAWLREWEQGAAASSALPATRTALGHFGAAVAVSVLLMGVADRPGFASFPDTFSLVVGLFPVVAGLRAGFLSSRRAALGAFYALSLLTLAGWGIHHLLPPAHPVSFLAEYGLFALVLWLPLGCSAAALGGAMKNRLGRAWRRGALSR